MRKLSTGLLALIFAAVSPGLAPYEAAAQVLERPMAPAGLELPLGAVSETPAEPNAPAWTEPSISNQPGLGMEPLSAAPNPAPSQSPNRPGLIARIKAVHQALVQRRKFVAELKKAEEKLLIDRTKE